MKNLLPTPEEIIERLSLTAGDTVPIVEMDGRTTYGEYVKNCNPEEGKVFSNSALKQFPDDYKLVYGVDGYFAMKEGDKIIFLSRTGEYISRMPHCWHLTGYRIQEAMAGEVKKAGYNSPEDMNGLAKEIRKKLWKERHENND